ncbi:MAG: MATE family efflux transporter [Saccharofermentans sp.]|nr:MATE family efflux transporter [Saccharofermentans sp.]
METKLTQGSPFQLILRFTLPLLLGNIIQQLYNTCDTILVGKYIGPQALAAVGSTGTIMFLILGLSNGMAMGFTILTSQRFGADDKEGTKLSVTNGIFLSLAVIAVMTTVSLLIMRPLLTAMKTPSDIFENAHRYISTICIGSFAMVLNNYFASLLRAIGNSKAPLCFMFGSAVLNIILDITFIVNFHWGVAGAAWATVLSQFAAATASVIYIVFAVPSLLPQKKHWKTDKKTIQIQLRLGIPMALQNGITASGTVIMQSAINRFGSVAVTAFTSSDKLQSILTQGMFTMGQTMAAYAGQNYGIGETNRIRKGIKAALKIMVVYTIFAAILIAFLIEPLLTIFFEKGTDLTIYMPYAKTNIFINMTCYLPLAMIFIYRNTIQACDRGVRAMTMGMVELVARLIMSGISMATGIFALAVASNGFAWLCAGVFGLFVCNHMLKEIDRDLMASRVQTE